MAASELSYEKGESSGGIKDGGEWMISIMEEKSLPPQRDKIQKVVPQLRKGTQNNESFDPAIVSIGPYHHGRPELKEMEIFKARMARSFVADSERDIQEFRNKILEVVSDARSCYLDGSTDAYDDEAFVRMMFVDGCFLLYFIEKYLQNESEDLTELSEHLGYGRQPMLMGDLILLENQLPFLVLQTLASTRCPEDQGKGFINLIETFIDKSFLTDLDSTRKKRYSYSTKYDGDEQPLHILELARRRCVCSHSPAMTGQISSSEGEESEDQPRRCSFNPPSWSIFEKRLRGHRATKQEDSVNDMFRSSFRSATELKARGIHFRPSNTCFLNDFTFTSRCLYGVVKIPQVLVGDQTKKVFLNMMADELAPSRVDKLDVCCYIYFMNSLINGADDVIELRSHNIIHNFLGTDEEVAKLFNALSSFTVIPIQTGKIKDVTERIQEHYNSKRKTWTAQLLHNYFSSPWAVFAFFAATFALVLTFIQTFFPRN
ncbi:UPF0481 protein At3g47200-like [Cornus florida]|uniref:UPF0481 protein At3g47200-like n=1 Tax=Cornus florida TaxID=4283 RepID=UPI00289C4967|nr:UPF0481 protein At3g47200-like [Cornus florida]